MLLAASVILFVAAFGVFLLSPLQADEAPDGRIGVEGPDGLPLKEPTPRDGAAVSIDAARQQLAEVAGVGDLIGAVEAADTEAVLSQLVQRPMPCEVARTTTDQCEDGESISTVQISDSLEFQLPVAAARVWLDLAMSGDGGRLPTLQLVTRAPSGQYLVAFSTQPLEVSDELRSVIRLNGPIDGLGFVVTAGEVVAVSPLLPTWGPLEWAQAHGAGSHELVAPESLDGFVRIDD